MAMTMSDQFFGIWDWRLFFSTFSVIALAELPDKTAIATLLMAARGNPVAVFLGVALAFLVQSIVAVCFGQVFALLPENWVHFGSGLLFFGFAISMWRKEAEDDKVGEIKKTGTRAAFWKKLWSAFIVIFIAEWGDLTQLATASLTARYHKGLTIFTAATTALWFVTAIAVVAGSKLKGRLHPGRLNRVAALVFMAVGVYMMATLKSGN